MENRKAVSPLGRPHFTDCQTSAPVWEVFPLGSAVKICFLPSYPASKLHLPQQHLLKTILQLLLTVDSTIPISYLNPPPISLGILSCTHVLLHALFCLPAPWPKLLPLLSSCWVLAWEMGLAGPTALLTMMMVILELADKSRELFSY